MDNSTAVKIINNLKFMPGWSFDAIDAGNETVMARVLIETVNSNRDQARLGYPQKVTLERGSVIHPQDYATADDLSAAVFTWLTEIWLHEAREFLRLGSDYLRAPFHPHKLSGENAWDSLITQTAEDPMRGLIVLNV